MTGIALTPPEGLALAFGFGGQGWGSERAHRSVVPTAFWYLCGYAGVAPSLRGAAAPILAPGCRGRYHGQWSLAGHGRPAGGAP